MSQPEFKKQPTAIAISASTPAKAERYIQWLRFFQNHPMTFHILTPEQSVQEATQILEQCAALLLTGGKDIHPARYGMEDRAALCKLEPERDELEFALFEAAQEAKKPILGICRGCQLINVALGGTLYVDIPEELPAALEHRKVKGQDSEHLIAVVGGSLLFKISTEVEGTVNSAHHQAIHQLGRGLRAVAYSPDQIIEAIEWESLYGSNFLLGVQWHPERMDWNSPFSGKIAAHFLFEAESYALLLA